MKRNSIRFIALCLVAIFALLAMNVAALSPLAGDTDLSHIERNPENSDRPDHPLPELPCLATLSSWAAEQVHDAIAENLVPEQLQADFTQAITRAEFCSLAVALYESRRGVIQGRVEFSDTNDVNVEKAAYIGVVTGVGDGRFNPNETLTREQAAVMLDRLIGLFGFNAHNIFPRFDDNQDISGWAVSAVGHIQAREIMGGVGGNRFAPRQSYTREQSIVTIMRVLGLVSAGLFADPVTLAFDYEELTLEEARLDPDFGAFMPVNVPNDLTFENGWRTSDESDNSIRLIWGQRNPALFWMVGEPREDELERIVPAAERHKFDVSLYSTPWFESVPDEIREYFHDPVFLADEMSLEVVQARARWDEGRRGESASWVIENFTVLYGDVIIRINARGVSPEQIWEMIAEIIK